MPDVGLDPVKLILMLLRGAAFFFAACALFGLSAYVIFLCLEIFSPRPRAKAAIAKVPQPFGCAPVAEPAHDLVPGEAPALPEGAKVTREEELCEGSSRVDFPGVSPHQLSSMPTRNV